MQQSDATTIENSGSLIPEAREIQANQVQKCTQILCEYPGGHGGLEVVILGYQAWQGLARPHPSLL